MFAGGAEVLTLALALLLVPLITFIADIHSLAFYR